MAEKIFTLDPSLSPGPVVNGERRDSDEDFRWNGWHPSYSGFVGDSHWVDHITSGGPTWYSHAFANIGLFFELDSAEDLNGSFELRLRIEPYYYNNDFPDNNPGASITVNALPYRDYEWPGGWDQSPPSYIENLIGPNPGAELGRTNFFQFTFDDGQSSYTTITIPLSNVNSAVTEVDERVFVGLRVGFDPYLPDRGSSSSAGYGFVTQFGTDPSDAVTPQLHLVSSDPGNGDDPGDPGPQPSGIVAVTAHIREDRFFAIDDQGRTWMTDVDGGTTLIRREDIPTGTPQWRGLWRDGDIPGLLYFAAGEGGIWKSVDGFATEGGYFPLRQPGVDGSPANAIHRRVGLHGALGEAPTPPPQGNVYLTTHARVMVRTGPNAWETLIHRDNLPGIALGDILVHLASPVGSPSILYLRGNNKMWMSENGGNTWDRIFIPEGASGGNVSGMFCKPNTPDNVYFTIRQNTGSIAGTWRSVDRGQTWERITGHFYSVGVQGPHGGAFSRDGSRLWIAQRANTLPGTSGIGDNLVYTDTESEPVHATGVNTHGYVVVHPTQNPKLIYISRANLVTSSAPWRVEEVNGVVTRTTLSNGLLFEGNMRAQRIATSGQTRVLLLWGTGSGLDQQRVYRSDDRGDNWQLALGPVNELRGNVGIASHPNNPDEFWVSGGHNGGGHVFYTQDGGVTWQMEYASDVQHQQIFVAG